MERLLLHCLTFSARYRNLARHRRCSPVPLHQRAAVASLARSLKNAELPIRALSRLSEVYTAAAGEASPLLYGRSLRIMRPSQSLMILSRSRSLFFHRLARCSDTALVHYRLKRNA